MTDRLRHTVLNLSRICRGIGKQVAGFDSSIVNPIDLLTEDRSHHHHTVLNARIYYYIEWFTFVPSTSDPTNPRGVPKSRAVIEAREITLL